MIKNTFILSVLIGILFGCKKFNHENLNITPPSCDLCAFADSLNGTYRGKVLYNELPEFVTGSDNYDSLTITVNHIFFNSDPYGDSLYMNFETSLAFDSIPGITYDTIQIRSASGKVHNSHLGSYYILPDSIKIYHLAKFQTGPTHYVDYTKMYGVLLKQ